MEGSQQRPDSGFERLVRTYIKRELGKLPDVRVVPEGKDADWRVSLIGWEGTTPVDVGTGNVRMVWRGNRVSVRGHGCPTLTLLIFGLNKRWHFSKLTLIFRRTL